tara:strand:- start:1187 stop:2329 length:1143 start_codon:yes stop_codon:yes gene_type:complete
MKKILFRKILLDYMRFFFLALISTAVVIWVFQAVNFLDIMIEDGRDYLVYINFSVLNFPKIISRIYPFVLFFSLFYVTTKYELNNELIIFWNFGVHKMRIINFIFLISIVLLFLQIILTAFVVPKSQDLARSFLRSSTISFYDNFIKPRKFIDTIKGVTIYADKKDEKGNLNNLYLKKEFEKNDFQVTYAKKGEFKQIGDIPILVLYDGSTITSKNNEVTNFSFSKSDFSLANLESNTTTYKKTQEISSLQLIRCINSFYKLKKDEFELRTTLIENCSIENLNNIMKEFYKRFIIPFYIPILCLIPFLLITSSKENLNYNQLRLITFLIGLFVVIFSETTIRMISKTTIQNFSIFMIPIIFFLLIYFFLFYKFNFQIKKK